MLQIYNNIVANLCAEEIVIANKNISTFLLSVLADFFGNEQKIGQIIKNYFFYLDLLVNRPRDRPTWPD